MSEPIQAEAGMLKELVIPSNPENIHQVESFIESIRAEMGFRDDVYGNVMVAITEAVNNSIYHGNGNDDSKRVFIRVESVNLYRISVVVEDEGTGFDPDKLPDPTAPENLSNPGGRGVFLMRHLADEIVFENEGRKVEMLFNI
jgi:serine/threonine-protein kinase RsbW